VFPELTLGYLNPQGRQPARHLPVQKLRPLRRRSRRKTGTAAPATVSVQGELRHQQYLAADFENRPVQFAFIVRKNPEVNNLFGQVGGILRRIIPAHTQEHD
jgi:hypothetical protein